ncbi:MAG: hypothetical protein H0T61_06365 [Actinobacteria bacterium]|nr:hypothetical protein [Actinomycetota bacterium]
MGRARRRRPFGVLTSVSSALRKTAACRNRFSLRRSCSRSPAAAAATPKVQELKFYARGVGPLLSIHLDGAGGRAALVSYTPGKS